MYDLFGDLPEAKKNTKGTNANNQNSTSETSNNNEPKQSQATSIPSNETRQHGSEQNPTVGNKKSVSIVQSIGNAGKMTSFIPLALKRRKVNNTSTIPKKRSTNTATVKFENQADVVDIHNQPRQVMIIHQDETKITTPHNDVIMDSNDTKEQYEGNTEIKPHLIQKENDIDDETSHFTESEELQKLHSSLHPYDMYDPMEPNDYLSYRKNKQNEMRRLDLERQAIKTLELQQQLREHIEEERKKILESGDINRIIESRGDVDGGNSGAVVRDAIVGRGRGRGRGMTNLPAWLIQKQKEQEQQELSTRKQIQDGQFDDENTNQTAGYTVVLTNMVGVGEVDDELSEEVREECETKCGKVIRVRIEEADHVKVYVTFAEIGDANKAPGIFDGRMFGQRQISAKLL